MDLNSLKDFKLNVWYRGARLLSITKIEDNMIVFSNADKINIDSNDFIYLNDKLLCNMPDMSPECVLDMYKWYLKKKGYKFLD